MKAPIAVCFALLASAATQPVRAQFSPAFLQNGSYWDDGKAEVDLYDAQVMRDGQLRPCEMLMILTPADFSRWQPGDDKIASPPPSVPAIRMSQMMTVPTGLVNEHWSSTIFFARDGRLLQSQLSRATPDGPALYRAFYSAGAKEMTIELSQPGGSAGSIVNGDCFLRDEMPLRVRLLDFSKAPKEFNVSIVDVPRAMTPDGIGALPAKVTFKSDARAIIIEIRGDKGADSFTVDRDFPFLLRDWKTADGSVFHLKNSLKADYRKFLKEGDREKALKDPMLRHPD